MHDMSLPFAAPPRSVPLSLRILNYFNGGAQFGWVFFDIGMLFCGFFADNADFSFLTFHADAEARGRVTRVESTAASENKQPVRALVYEYSVAGRTLTGTSYVTGQNLPEGAEVTVEYEESTPERSRISGMRRALFSPWAAFVVIFPLVGFVIMTACTAGGVRRNHLLREGILTTGKLLRRERTNVSVNKRPVWKLIFEFTDRTGQRQETEVRTAMPSLLEDDAREPLLYDPNDPSTACLLDEAPSRPRFEAGQLAGRPFAAIAALIVPSIVVGAALAFVAVKWL
jgi:hypothetical protein